MPFAIVDLNSDSEKITAGPYDTLDEALQNKQILSRVAAASERDCCLKVRAFDPETQKTSRTPLIDNLDVRVIEKTIKASRGADGALALSTRWRAMADTSSGAVWQFYSNASTWALHIADARRARAAGLKGTEGVSRSYAKDSRNQMFYVFNW